MASSPRSIDAMLCDAFAAKHIKPALKHFGEMVEELRLAKWEKSIAKGGKFIEAALKAIWVLAGEVVPAGKLFKAGTIIDQLPNKTSLDDSVRLTIPRACRVIYEIASNRGGRHDPGEVDPNEMDAQVVVANAQWILAEMVRFSQKGSAAPDEAAERVSELTKRRFPFFENIDGRIYTEIGRSARDVGLMVLFFGQKRMSSQEVIASIARHGHSKNNAAVALTRLKTVVDDDGQGNLKLRLPGIRKAEAMIEKAKSLR
jgi:hypothetical protein